MSSEAPTFVDQALTGEVLLFEIDEFVQAWHEGQDELPLNEYLGMNEREYDLWLSDPDMLAHIVRARREHMSLEQLVESAVNDNQALQAHRIAARTDDTVKVDRLKRWLAREGIDFT